MIGGRARGKDRPRAPSLKERPSGDPRILGIGVPAAAYVEGDDVDAERRNDEQSTRAMMSDESSDADNEGEKKEGWQVDSSAEHTGFTQVEDDEDDEDRPQRLFSVGGTDERSNWTEANARRRMGFKDDEEPGG